MTYRGETLLPMEVHYERVETAYQTLLAFVMAHDMTTEYSQYEFEGLLTDVCFDIHMKERTHYMKELADARLHTLDILNEQLEKIVAS